VIPSKNAQIVKKTKIRDVRFKALPPQKAPKKTAIPQFGYALDGKSDAERFSQKTNRFRDSAV
jgi:hypothetical protein